jgi:non-specific serine/threonine protein kinase
LPEVPDNLKQALADRYRIEREIGRGGMATVYLAEDLKHHREVALKVLAPEIAMVLGPERFLREIEIAARLTHPHILPLFDSGAVGEVLFYVTPYIEGHSLRDRIRQERQLPIDEVVQLGREVASALACAHAQGIVHRDVKPENILLAAGAALVADFGIARALSAGGGGTLTETGVVLGTPAYMSPEQASGGEVDHRTDLYSLGCVLYETLAGEPPFTGPNPQTLQSRHALEPPPPLGTRRPGLPESLERAIVTALAKTPVDRHSTAARFAESLNMAVLGGVTPTAITEATAVPNNLPAARTTFVGRDRELAEGARLLGETRVLTLTGVGGSGKTRLAVRLAETLTENHPDGVWFVDLAPLDADTLVAQELATTLHIKEEAGKDLIGAIVHQLSGKRVLLILDNCEHLLGATADLADRLLPALPELKLLVTSREGLGITGERLFAVRSLALPPENAEADPEAVAAAESARLFLARARDVDRDFVIDRSNAAAIAEVCRRLDGIPLALELAAVRTRALSVEQIRDMLDDRFRLLTGGSRSAIERHRTLRATVQWSYDHLEDEEKELFVVLAVFSGGWTLPAAAAVTDSDEFDVLDLLTRLIDKSLVVPERQSGNETRYRMLETLRQFGEELLSESGRADELRAVHLDYFDGLVASMRDELKKAFPSAAIARLKPEIDNLRAALTWGFANKTPAAVQLTLHLNRLWIEPGNYAEGRRWYRRVLDLGDAVELKARSETLFRSGRLAFQQGDYEDALELYSRELEALRELGDRRNEARCLSRIAGIRVYNEEYESADRIHEEAHAIHQEIDDPNGYGRLENSRGMVAYLRGNLKEARQRFDKSLATFRELRDLDRIQVGQGNLALVDVAEGDGSAARERLRECMQINQNLQNLYGIAHDLPTLAAAFRLEGDSVMAARMLGAADALIESTDAALEGMEQKNYQEIEATLRNEIGDAAFASARQEGRAITWERVVELT